MNISIYVVADREHSFPRVVLYVLASRTEILAGMICQFLSVGAFKFTHVEDIQNQIRLHWLGKKCSNILFLLCHCLVLICNPVYRKWFLYLCLFVLFSFCFVWSVSCIQFYAGWYCHSSCWLFILFFIFLQLII